MPTANARESLLAMGAAEAGFVVDGLAGSDPLRSINSLVTSLTHLGVRRLHHAHDITLNYNSLLSILTSLLLNCLNTLQYNMPICNAQSHSARRSRESRI